MILQTNYVSAFAEMAADQDRREAPTDLEIERGEDSHRVRVTWASTPPAPDDYKMELRCEGPLSDDLMAAIQRDVAAWQAAPHKVFSECKELIDG